MEFIIGALLGAVVGWGLTKLWETRPTRPEELQPYIYVCEHEGCFFMVDTNIEAATKRIAEAHERDSHGANS